MFKHVFAMAVLASSGAAAGAQPLKPIHASTIDLGTTQGSAYYVVEPKGYRVIMTLETDSKPIRFDALLADGQAATVSVPAASGDRSVEVTFARHADKLDVSRSAPADAVTASTK